MDHGSVRRQAQPGQISQNLVRELWPAARGVDVFDPHQIASALGARRSKGELRGVCVA